MVLETNCNENPGAFGLLIDGVCSGTSGRDYLSKGVRGARFAGKPLG